MGLITKINGLTFASVAKYSGVTTTNTKKVGGANNFHNKNAASKSITAPGDDSHAIIIADSDGDFKFTDDTACSFSFWIKPMWNSSLGTSILLFAMTDTGSSSQYDNGWRIYYKESNNRLYAEFSSGGSSSNNRHNFWHFHDTGIYLTAKNAANLGGSGTTWHDSNRGNVGNDDYTMITITKGTANSSLHSNFKLYWNATDCGEGFYRSGSGGGSGTANLSSTNDKKVVIGSTASNYSNAGNNEETRYMNLTIWDKELSSSEVTELYNSGAPLNAGVHSAYDNCVGWYPFQDDGVGHVSGNVEFSLNGDSNIAAK